MNKNRTIQLTEVSMRDGLQNQPTLLTPEQRADFLKGFLDAGHRNLEIGSYVNPKLLPQMKETSKVVELLREHADYESCQSIALTFNQKGVEQALLDPITTLGFVCGCSDSFNQKNMGKNIEASLKQYQSLALSVKDSGKKIRFYLSTITECPHEGKISLERFQDLCRQISEQVQPDQLILSDTIGAVLPTEIKNLVETASRYFEMNQLGFHFHDPYGRAILNVHEALVRGIDHFDMSAAGLGGCPASPNAQGNVASEELMDLILKLGYTCPIDMPKHLQTTQELIQHLNFTSSSKAYNTYCRDLLEEKV